MQHVTHTHTLPSFKHHTHYSKVSSTTRTPPRSQAPHALHQGFKYHTHSTKVSSTTRTPPRSQAPHALHQGLKHHTHSTKVSSTTQYYHDVLKAGCCGLTITARKRRKGASGNDAYFSISRWSPTFKLSPLSNRLPLASSGSALVPAVPGDT